jgi:hypothetical protein
MRHQTTRQHIVFVRCGLAAAVVVASLAGAASISAAAGAHAITSTRSGASRSTAGVAIDRRIARAAELRRADFPAGWTSSPGPTQTTGSGCPGLAGAIAAVSAQAYSRNFMLGDVATAQSANYVYADTPTAIHWFAQLTSRRTMACLVRVVREAAGFQAAAQGATLDSITQRPLIIEPVGDEHFAHLLIVRVSAGAARATAYADVIYVRVGRAVAAFSLGSVNQLFDPALENKLATAVARRLASGMRGS